MNFENIGNEKVIQIYLKQAIVSSSMIACDNKSPHAARITAFLML